MNTSEWTMKDNETDVHSGGARKVLYLHRTQAAGVEGVHIGQIVKHLRQLGNDVQIFSPVGEYVEILNPKKSTANERTSTGAGLAARVGKRLPEFLFELAEIAYSLVSAVQALWRFRNERFDAIYERYAIFGFVGLVLSTVWRVPLVLEVNYTSQSPLVRQRSRWLQPLAKLVDGWLYRRAHGLLPVSSFLRDELIRDFGVQPQRVTVVPNAADPAEFDPDAQHVETTADTQVIGFVGGFYPWHGVDLLLDAFSLIAPRLPRARLLLIGDGPMRPAIEAKAQTLGIAERVTLPGKIAHADLSKAVASFCVGVMPDSNEYGSPMKIFEYMAMRKPVIVPDYGPLRDAVTDGVEGLFFPPRRVDALAECLSTMLSDETRRTRMGQAARERIVERNNWRRNAETVQASFKNSNEVM
jgi:glycosyltransferase involved in cell wall biosynthesis